MTTDEVIQLFRLLDLTKLRKVVDRLPDKETQILTKVLLRAQRVPAPPQPPR